METVNVFANVWLKKDSLYETFKESCLELTDLSTKHSVDFRGGGS